MYTWQGRTVGKAEMAPILKEDALFFVFLNLQPLLQTEKVFDGQAMLSEIRRNNGNFTTILHILHLKYPIHISPIILLTCHTLALLFDVC